MNYFIKDMLEITVLLANSQVKTSDTYDLLQKCITLNIVDFKCTPLKKLHFNYHLTVSNSLPDAVLTKIQSLKVANIYIIGGAGAVSTGIEDVLKGHGLNVTRITKHISRRSRLWDI